MKKKYVYQLVNENNIVEYIGESFNPQRRFREHKHNRTIPKSGMGKFVGRNDLRLEVLAEFDKPKDSFNYQCQLQTKYFGINERDVAKENGMKGKPFAYLGAIERERRKRAGIINS